MRRALLFALLLAATLLVAGFATRGGGDAPSEPVDGADGALEAELPAWVAPGGALRVRGLAAPGEAVTLALDGEPVARAVAAEDGTFALTGRAGEPGVVRVAVNGHVQGSVPVRPVTLAAVGDVLPGAGPKAWSAVRETIAAADVATANLEGAVSVRGAPVAGKDYHFRGAPLEAKAIAEAGVDVVSLANNHVLDYGREALADTLRYAQELGLKSVGAGRDLAHARRPAFVERGGVRIAFLAYSDVNPLGFPAGEGVSGTARARPDQVREDVERAAKRADVVVVWFHWGEELHPEPTGAMQSLAAAALNGGAHVVLGAHQHVLGDVVVPLEGRLVAWSLGNFVFPAYRPDTTRSAILHVELDAHGVRAHRLQPVRIKGDRPVPVG